VPCGQCFKAKAWGGRGPPQADARPTKTIAPAKFGAFILRRRGSNFAASKNKNQKLSGGGKLNILYLSIIKIPNIF
jgi:hypothetical protein